MSLES
ncbi:hypothetical protein RB213_005233 [Colletotrichum asianum]